MTLTDTGPLVGMLDRRDGSHRKCVEVVGEVRLPMLTTLPVLTEVLYILQNRAGWKTQSVVFKLIHDGRLVITDMTSDTLYRAEELMAKYADLPMDFADASLVAVAEARNMDRVFTLDEHFRIYRLRGREPFDIIPRQE